MAYIKNNWVDREGTTRYFETVDDDGALILTPDYTQVTEMGTPVNADNMNHIEDGIAAGSFTKYDSMATYAKNDLVTTIVDNELKVYKSLQDNNTNTLDDSSSWEEVEFSGGGGSVYQMFDTVLKDHVLTYEESKGLALQGTYVYKTAIAGSRYGYPDFYSKCVEERNTATATQVTLSGSTITMYIASNGHQYYDIANKGVVDNFFGTMGSAWFYGVDTANERIFLPRNKYYSLSLNKDSANVHSRTGSSVDVSTVEMMPYYNTSTGALVTGSDAGVVYPGIDGGGRIDRISNDDSGTHSSYTMGHSLYVDSADIVESNTDYYLYICVGNTVSDTSWVDVVTQVEGGVKDLEDKTNEGIEALSNASNALRQTQITNCLLEVPQNIKLELTEGVLTLKTGSKVIVPNGFEADGTTAKFDEVVIENDLSLTWTQGEYNLTLFYVASGRQQIVAYSSNADKSGAEIPTGVSNFYNTETNTVYRYSSNGQGSQLSFPIARVTSTTNAFSSIDQVFNGMGYIGSTIWADKGVKGLIPNGRNVNGSLNNIEFVTENIITRTMSGDVTRDAVLGLNSNSIGRLYFNDYSYNYEDNYIRNATASAEWSYAIIGTYNDANGVISNFQPKLPFRAVDYNDKSEISGWGAPSGKYIDLTLGASETSYIAPANGYFYLDKMSTAAGQGFKFRGNDNVIGNKFIAPAASQPIEGCSMLTLKGEKVTLWYTLGGTTRQFRFYYAEGDK